jgi:ABC-type transport system involved in multi-copper enzyme maturation permease subunit
MTQLLLSEAQRLWARRITRAFPAILALFMLAGIVIAYFVIDNDEGNSPDFVNSIGGGIQATELLGPITGLLPVMAFVIGASSIGADIKTGMLEQILTWEPRRLRFLAARMTTVISGVAVIAVVLASYMVALLYVLAALTGTTDGTTGEFWGNVAFIILRTGLAAGLFAALGLAVTVVVNNSIGSIVGFVIYWFIIESFLVTAFLPKVAVYLPITNADSFASGKDVERVDGSIFAEDFGLISSHDYLVAGLYTVGWMLLTAGAAAALFQRRDIDG